MKTRSNKKYKCKTKRGGKDAKDNYKNFFRYWKNETNHKNYNPQLNYPGRINKLMGKILSFKNFDDKKNTYIFERHGFSCANLLKEKKSYEQYTESDPSLCTYGILSLLAREPKHSTNVVFVSSLIRTWQTAILEYGNQDLTIIISPYIKEKHHHSYDVANLPLPLDQQKIKMKQFMNFLQKMTTDDREINIKQTFILKRTFTFKYNDEKFTLGPYTALERTESESEYINLIKQDVDIVNQEEIIKTVRVGGGKNVFVPVLKKDDVIPTASIREYYGGKGFLYFDHWVKKNYPDYNKIYVVSHSGFMQSIIKLFSELDFQSSVFKENAWKMILTPIESDKFNYSIELNDGLPKPHKNMLLHMIKEKELLCNAIQLPDSRNQAISDPIETISEHNSPNVSQSEHVESEPIETISEHNSPIVYKAEHYVENEPESRESISQFRERKSEPRESISQSRERKSEPRESISQSRERKSEPIEEHKVEPTREFISQQTKLTHSFDEFKQIINTKYTSLFKLINASDDEIIHYIDQNPDLFQNHFMAMILIQNSFFKDKINSLKEYADKETAATGWFGKTTIYTIKKAMSVLLKIQGLYISLDNVSIQDLYTFLQKIQELLYHENFQNKLVDVISKNANTQYLYEGFCFTLLDLVVYFMCKIWVLKEDELIYIVNFISKLIDKGARFSKNYKQKNLGELAQLEYHKKVYLQQYMLMPLVKDCASPKKSEMYHQFLLYDEGAKILNTVKGGSKGTSWKKSSLRQSSVKGGRYRSSLYKGKRRSKAIRH
jgi:hypothetical protein